MEIKSQLSSTQFHYAPSRATEALSPGWDTRRVMLQGPCCPFRAQMQGTWPLWELTGQPRNRLFQPSLREEKKAHITTSNGFSFLFLSINIMLRHGKLPVIHTMYYTSETPGRVLGFFIQGKRGDRMEANKFKPLGHV